MPTPSIPQLFQNAAQSLSQNRPGDAERLCRQILALQPNHAGAMHMTGVILSQRGDPAAVQFLRQAVALNPADASIHKSLALALAATAHNDEAIQSIDQAVRLRPNDPELLFYCGNFLQQASRLDEAIAAYRKSIAIAPRAPAHANLAAALLRKGLYDSAVQSCRTAIQLDPNFLSSYINIGISLQALRQDAAATDAFNKALRIDPNCHEARLCLGMMQLTLGDMTSGWTNYEARLQRDVRAAGRHLPQPRWTGQDISGKTLLLRSEQGFGDSIQFIRYAPMLAQRGINVLLECQAELRRLFMGQLNLQQVVNRGDPLPAFDFHCPLMSLPRLFGTTLENIPRQIPYLRPDPAAAAQWAQRLQADSNAFHVGLVWAGRPTKSTDFIRSIPLEQLSPLASVPNVRLYSLQVGPAGAQARSAPAGMNLIDWTADLGDFADTAALVAGLDLVITVDTAATHLAGALARPAWVLLPTAPDFRWLLDRDDSPWYPTLRLFRQSTQLDWHPVIQRVTEELEKEAARSQHQ